jgi:hypothetical protein
MRLLPHEPPARLTVENVRQRIRMKGDRIQCPAHGGVDFNCKVWERGGEAKFKCYSHHCPQLDIRLALLGLAARPYSAPLTQERKILRRGRASRTGVAHLARDSTADRHAWRTVSHLTWYHDCSGQLALLRAPAASDRCVSARDRSVHYAFKNWSRIRRCSQNLPDACRP